MVSQGLELMALLGPVLPLALALLHPRCWAWQSLSQVPPHFVPVAPSPYPHPRGEILGQLASDSLAPTHANSLEAAVIRREEGERGREGEEGKLQRETFSCLPQGKLLQTNSFRSCETEDNFLFCHKTNYCSSGLLGWSLSPGFAPAPVQCRAQVGREMGSVSTHEGIHRVGGGEEGGALSQGWE